MMCDVLGQTGPKCRASQTMSVHAGEPRVTRVRSRTMDSAPEKTSSALGCIAATFKRNNPDANGAEQLCTNGMYTCFGFNFRESFKLLV